MLKRALMVATVPSMIGCFNMDNIHILLNMGYEVHVACNFKDRSVWPKEKIKELIYEFKKLNIIYHQIDFCRNPRNVKKVIRSFCQMRNLLKTESFSLIHCHTPVGGVIGRLSSYINHVPVILYTAHGFHFFKGCPLKNWLFFFPIEKCMSHFTDILITINNEDYEMARKKFYAKRTERIHGVGIDIEKFDMPLECRADKRKELGVKDEEIMLFSVGELDRNKNHIEILKAMKILAPKGYKYYIAGKGSLMDSHNEYIQSNGLEQSVKLLGYRRDIPELLQAADIYVFPSLSEGLSVALMEAVAAKIPVVCSKIRGNTDTIITEESYFSAKSSADAAHTIEYINLMDDKEKKRIVEKNYINLLQYQLSVVQIEMSKIYRIADKAAKKRMYR